VPPPLRRSGPTTTTSTSHVYIHGSPRRDVDRVMTPYRVDEWRTTGRRAWCFLRKRDGTASERRMQLSCVVRTSKLRETVENGTKSWRQGSRCSRTSALEWACVEPVTRCQVSRVPAANGDACTLVQVAIARCTKTSCHVMGQLNTVPDFIKFSRIRRHMYGRWQIVVVPVRRSRAGSMITHRFIRVGAVVHSRGPT
jgi:hypothetical protein